jgi:hypothetical protein
MRRTIVTFCLGMCACPSPTPKSHAPERGGRIEESSAESPAVYRAIHHAIHGGDGTLVVAGQMRAPDDTRSSAWVARVKAHGPVVWSWVGRGEWEIAELVATDGDTIVVAGRSSPRSGPDAIWVRAFSAKGTLAWTTRVAGDGAILDLTLQDRSVRMQWAKFASHDVETVTLDAAGEIVDRATIRFQEGSAAVEPGAPDSVEYPARLDVAPVAFGPLDTPERVYTELRWWIEAGGPDEFPTDDDVVLTAVDLLDRQGCEPFEYALPCHDTGMLGMPVHTGIFTDPCAAQETLADIVERASPAVLARLRDRLLADDLFAEHPRVRVLTARARDIGLRDVAAFMLAQDELRKPALAMLERAPTDELRTIELALREKQLACDVVATLRDKQKTAGAALDPLPTAFTDPCAQIYAACAAGEGLASMLPPGKIRVRTTCAADYPKDPDEGLAPCRAGVRRTRELPDLSAGDAFAQCSDGVVTTPEFDPAGDCGVRGEYEDATISFRHGRAGRFVIDRIDVEMQARGGPMEHDIAQPP